MEESRSNSRPQSRPPQSRGKKRRRSGGRAAASALLYVVAVIGVSVALAAVAWLCAGDVLALNKAPATATVTLSSDLFTEKEVTVKEKDDDGKEVETKKTVSEVDVAKVAGLLKESGLIEYEPVFRLFAAFTGAKTKMAPGTYTLTTDMDYRAIISSMSAGSTSRSVVSVTIPEGYSVDQIFQLLEDKGVSTVAELQKTAANHDYKFSFLEDVPLGDYHRLAGYLFPDTYQFYIGEDPLYALNKMMVNFSNMVPQEMRDTITESGRTLHEVLTVASLIEKETDGTDKALIASVIYNRLNHPEASTNGYLQIDATLAYLNGGKTPTEADKSIDSPYNTYLYPGLPPGPIANPGSEAIWAAIHPKDSDYYYYALGEDGFHHYSRTYNEHQAFLDSLD